MGDRPDARPLPTQDNTTHRNADTHPCPEQDSNLRYQSIGSKYLPAFNGNLYEMGNVFRYKQLLIYL